ncbi:MAG: 16S rRNA pseudouridine(516) synthase [Burkholderiaceae bacterium]|nr:16S rRNA pseudouridine(516) synthase [Burkholderiaceae bacterium]
MQLQDILYAQGFGTRRVCAGLIQQGHVLVRSATNGGWLPCTDAGTEFEPEGLGLRVQGLDWVCHVRACIMLHKPAGIECSQKPSAWPSVYTLLPAPLRQRPNKGAVQGVQAIGRLDQDTTGLLLLTDDGQLIHRLASPKHDVPKVYEVTLKHPADAVLCARLLAGVVLDDDPRPVRAAACELDDPQHLRLTLTGGKYHQVKRMVAAAGNRVEALHRSQIGGLRLPADLAVGQWRWLQAADLALLGV